VRNLIVETALERLEGKRPSRARALVAAAAAGAAAGTVTYKLLRAAPAESSA
jgi:hypothetical protein